MKIQGEKEWRAALEEDAARLRAEQELELARPLSTVEYRDRHRLAQWRDNYRRYLITPTCCEKHPNCECHANSAALQPRQPERKVYQASMLDVLRQSRFVRQYFRFLNDPP